MIFIGGVLFRQWLNFLHLQFVVDGANDSDSFTKQHCLVTTEKLVLLAGWWCFEYNLQTGPHINNWKMQAPFIVTFSLIFFAVLEKHYDFSFNLLIYFQSERFDIRTSRWYELTLHIYVWLYSSFIRHFCSYYLKFD